MSSKTASWLIGRDQLLAAAEVMNLVSAQPGVPSSEFFRIVRGKDKSKVEVAISSIVTGHVRMSGKGHWPVSEYFLDRKVFLPFIQAAKDIKSDAPFEFGLVDKELVVKHGKRKGTFGVQPTIPGYGEFPKDKSQDKVVLSPQAQSLVYCARDCAPNDPVTPQLNCVYIKPNGKGIDILATNQKVLFHATAKSDVSSSFPFPLSLVSLLGSDKLKEIHWRSKFVALHFDEGVIWQPVSSQARKEFPTKKLLKTLKDASHQRLLFSANSHKLSKVLMRISSYLTAVRRADWKLELTGEKGKKEISLSSQIPGSTFKETFKLKSAIKESFKVNWPLSMLAPIFEYLEKDKEGTTEIRLHGKGELCYILAQHIRVGVSVSEV